MSWIQYDQQSEFPIENLPYGVFRLKGAETEGECATRIGEFVLSLNVLEVSGVLNEALQGNVDVFTGGSLNKFMSLGRSVWTAVRARLIELLGDNATLRDDEGLRAEAFFDVSAVEMLLPAKIGDYTDFYSSKEHATNLGKMFRPNEEALKPNWVWIPVGYHGRSSSIIPSGVDVRRPNGQVKPRTSDVPVFQACARLDFELEMAFFVGPGNKLGDPISIEEAEDNIFGVVLMNDWSARDIQAWEYVPLGPFNGKNLSTTISPWIVTMDALEPFRSPSVPKDPPTLGYLTDDTPSNYDINLEVYLDNERLETPQRICHSNLKYMYWSMKQQLVHHSVTGCNMQPGDLLGSGTISGPEDGMYGSMIELSWNGTRQLELSNGETRSFLEDGDNVIMRGWCQAEGFRVGFGECEGRVIPGHPLPN